MSISEWPSFMENIQLVRERLITSAYSMFGFEMLYNFHLGISKLLKEQTFTYLVLYVIRSHAGKPGSE